MNYQQLISQMLIIVAILVVFVNVITEVVKSFHNFKEAENVNIFVTILSIVLTVITLTVTCYVQGMAIAWYMYIAFIIVGFMVAYAAMFGYDKLLKYFDQV